jgi:hypothetical protein
VPSRQEETPEREEAVEPAASAQEPASTEVVFDLRESEHGFEGTYWKRQTDEPAADRDVR